MKIFAGKLFLFLLLLLVSDFLLGKVVGNFHSKTKNINLQNANYGFLNYDNDDILFFGASEVSHSFISNRVKNKTGLSSYNLASDGCGMYYQYPLLETILDKYTPKVILIGTYQLADDNSDYINRMYPYYNKNKYVKQIVEEIHPRESMKLIFQGYVYNSQIIRIFDGRGNNEKGYVPLTPRENKIDNQKVLQLPHGENYQISDEVKAYFIKFIERAGESGAAVYVYVPPILKNINREYLNTIKSLTKNTGAKLLDYSNDQTFLNRRELFNDEIHLNHEGAKILTDKFIEVMKKDSVY